MPRACASRCWHTDIRGVRSQSRGVEPVPDVRPAVVRPTGIVLPAGSALCRSTDAYDEPWRVTLQPARGDTEGERVTGWRAPSRPCSPTACAPSPASGSASTASHSRGGVGAAVGRRGRARAPSSGCCDSSRPCTSATGRRWRPWCCTETCRVSRCARPAATSCSGPCRRVSGCSPRSPSC